MTTTILVHTSAESAILHGCQHGWHRVDLDTQTLTPGQRELLAKSVKEDQGARYVRKPWYTNPSPYDVAPPTAEGLIAHLQDRLDLEAEQAAERQAQIDREIESYRQVLAAIERGQWLPDSVGVDVDVTCRAPDCAREVPEAQSLWARIEAAKKSRREDLWAAQSLADRIDTQRSVDLESVRERYPEIVAETERRIEEIGREREAEAAREREVYDRLYARLPETLRARHKAGYAGDDAIEDSIRALIIEDSRADAKWAEYVSESYDDATPTIRAESLTDDEFVRLRRIEKAAPEGAEVTARIVGWRKATDQEIEDGLADPEGEVRDMTPYAVVQWELGGVTASVVIPL